MPFVGFNTILRTLRIRLALWIIVVVLLMVGLTMLVVRQVVHRTLLFEFDQILRADSQEIALMIRQINEPAEKALNRHAMGHVHQQWFAEIYDTNGVRMWGTESTPEELPEPDFTPGQPEFVDSDSYRMLLTYLPRAGFWLRLGSSKQSLVEDVALLNRIMILATILIALVAPLGAYALAGRATRPLAWIIATTARLQPQKLDERLPLRGTNDELDQLSSTINGMLDRIASYIERHRDFIANAAHELRSPLAAIRSMVEVALNRPRSAEEYQGLLTDVIVEAGRLSNLVDRLLLLAEGDAGRHASRGGIVGLDRLVLESVEMFQAVAESRDIELRADHVEPVSVRGDEFHLRQVIRNLIDNAIKFNNRPGSVRVKTWGDQDTKRAYLEVSDTGPGIPSEALPRIFERFYRADKSRIREEGPGGYGLGLSICQLIVQSFDGEIRVRSGEGKGSTFTVELPLALPNRPALASNAAVV